MLAGGTYVYATPGDEIGIPPRNRCSVVAPSCRALGETHSTIPSLMILASTILSMPKEQLNGPSSFTQHTFKPTRVPPSVVPCDGETRSKDTLLPS